MDIQQELRKMPEPDPEAIDRVRSKFRASRTERTPIRATWLAPVLLMAAAAVLWIAVPRDAERELALNASGETQSLTWSDEVQLEFSGQGSVTGTSQDVKIDWEHGRIAVQVAPNTGTDLSIVTEEAIISVVGTAFTVERDRTGVTIEVTHGKVAVTCIQDDWSGHLVNTTGAKTCLPLTPVGLMARADVLQDRVAPAEQILHTLDIGLELAEAGTTEHGELLARRVSALTDLGERNKALADADAYLQAGHTTRKVEVQQSASRLALDHGCDRAMPYLEPLQETGSAEDRVYYAECLTDSARAIEILKAAIAELEAESDTLKRANKRLNALEGR